MSSAPPQAENENFYINIVLLNKEEVVANKVKQKTGNGDEGGVFITYSLRQELIH